MGVRVGVVGVGVGDVVGGGVVVLWVLVLVYCYAFTFEGKRVGGNGCFKTFRCRRDSAPSSC